MKIITVMSVKGGAGRTTTAVKSLREAWDKGQESLQRYGPQLTSEAELTKFLDDCVTEVHPTNPRIGSTLESVFDEAGERKEFEMNVH